MWTPEHPFFLVTVPYVPYHHLFSFLLPVLALVPSCSRFCCLV